MVHSHQQLCWKDNQYWQCIAPVHLLQTLSNQKDFHFHYKYNQEADPYPDKECQLEGKGSSEVSDSYLNIEDIQ